MNYSDINDRLQLAVSIGVIIGLILVIYEIRENTRIAENQAAIDMNALYGQWTTLWTDEDMAELFVKSLENPDELSRVELLQLHYAFTTASAIFKTNHFLLRSGGLSMYPESTLYDDTSAALSGPVARKFVLIDLAESDLERSEIMRQAINDTEPNARLEYLDSLRPSPEGAEQPD